MSTPANALDLETLLIHEIGHGLGLAHSSLTARMTAGQQVLGFQQRRTFLDDNVGITSLYDSFQQINGAARDIGVGGSEAVWIVSNTASGTNFKIQKRFGSNFVDANNGTGVRISVGPDGRPWIVNSAGEVWRRTTSSHTSGTWIQLPGCATDIGVGGDDVNFDGIAWITSCTSAGGGNFTIKKWNEATFSFQDANNGSGVRIAVDNTGAPWLVNAAGEIWWRSVGTPPAPSEDRSAPSTWTKTIDGTATDIDVSFGNYPWVIGTDNGIYVWNNQPPGGGTPPAPQLSTWRQVPGSGVAIAVGSGSGTDDASPYVVGSDRTIWRAKPGQL